MTVGRAISTLVRRAVPFNCDLEVLIWTKENDRRCAVAIGLEMKVRAAGMPSHVRTDSQGFIDRVDHPCGMDQRCWRLHALNCRKMGQIAAR